MKAPKQIIDVDLYNTYIKDCIYPFVKVFFGSVDMGYFPFNGNPFDLPPLIENNDFNITLHTYVRKKHTDRKFYVTLFQSEIRDVRFIKSGRNVLLPLVVLHKFILLHHEIFKYLTIGKIDLLAVYEGGCDCLEYANRVFKLDLDQSSEYDRIKKYLI